MLLFKDFYVWLNSSLNCSETLFPMRFSLGCGSYSALCIIAIIANLVFLGWFKQIKEMNFILFTLPHKRTLSCTDDWSKQCICKKWNKLWMMRNMFKCNKPWMKCKMFKCNKLWMKCNMLKCNELWMMRKMLKCN